MYNPKYRIVGIVVVILLIGALLYFGRPLSVLCSIPVNTSITSAEPSQKSGRRYTYVETLALHEYLNSKFEKEPEEGHSGRWNEKTVAYRALINRAGLKTVCEIGFNAGHSSLTWLAANPDIHLYSFDLPHDYQHYGVEVINEKFPGRLNLTNGNSLETLPQFFKEHPDVYCDIAHVDGGHTYEIAIADLKNFFPRLKPGGMLLIDDTLCPDKEYCIGPMKAWLDFLEMPDYKNKIAPLIYRYDIEHNNASGFQSGFVYSDD